MRTHRAVLLLTVAASSVALAIGPGHARSTPDDDVEAVPSLCYEAGRDRTLLSDDPLLRLCHAAPGIGPVRCFEEADSATLLSDDQMIDLCQCAQSRTPVDCFERTDSETFLPDDTIVALCSARTLGNLWRPDCR